MAQSKVRKFKLDPLFDHKRSEGMTRRRNGGSIYQLKDKHVTHQQTPVRPEPDAEGQESQRDHHSTTWVERAAGLQPPDDGPVGKVRPGVQGD